MELFFCFQYTPYLKVNVIKIIGKISLILFEFIFLLGEVYIWIQSFTSRIASSSPYTWQNSTNVVVPGNSLSISRQFLRCCLHQLAPNGIFPMLFQSSFEGTLHMAAVYILMWWVEAWHRNLDLVFSFLFFPYYFCSFFHTRFILFSIFLDLCVVIFTVYLLYNATGEGRH